MAYVGRKPDKGCPYFDKRMQSCGLAREGIYLPSSADVNLYCLTEAHWKCPLCFGNREWAEEQSPRRSDSHDLTEKRRYTRLPERRSVLLRIGEVQGEFVEIGTTVDFSPEGMRVLISREISMDKHCSFFFGSGFLVPGLQGTAHPCWQRPSPENPGFVEVGLAILDDYCKTRLQFELGAYDSRV